MITRARAAWQRRLERNSFTTCTRGRPHCDRSTMVISAVSGLNQWLRTQASQGQPCILVRPAADVRRPERSWELGGVPLLDSRNWDMRMILDGGVTVLWALHLARHLVGSAVPRCGRHSWTWASLRFVETHITPDQLNEMEPFYPLHAFVCDQCFLVQLDEFVAPAEIFSEYAYFSSYSSSWVAHARRYVDTMVERFRLNHSSRVVEIAQQ